MKMPNAIGAVSIEKSFGNVVFKLNDEEITLATWGEPSK
jgi:hypothetical protein